MSFWKAVQDELKPIFRPASTTIDGITPQDWASPNNPLVPVAPQIGVRSWDFRPALNLDFTPRGDLPVSFPMLRQISNSWDLCRLMIETRKDQIINRPWVIRVRPERGETKQNRLNREAKNTNVEKVRSLFEFPDGVHAFPTWMRMLLDQLLVYDAPCIYPVRNMLGDVIGFRVISGSTITPLVDEQGFTPRPPSPAYQQVILGIPASNLTATDPEKKKPRSFGDAVQSKPSPELPDQLIYAPRNPRCDSRWGFGPVEQIIATLAIASRRQSFLKAYYTEGNVPEGMLFAPESWTPDQIQSFQNWLDALLAGNLAKRRRLIMAPASKATRGIEWAKQNALTDATDEYLVKIVAFAFSITPQGLIKQMNRASAKQAADTSEEEGLEPYLAHITLMMNQIIWKVLDCPDVEFQYEDKRDVDPVKQAQVDQIYIDSGTYTRNEVRGARGDDPRPEKEADILTVTTAQGIQPLDAKLAADRQQTLTPEPAEPEPGEPGRGAKKKAHKREPLKLPAKLTSANEAHKAKIGREVAHFLKGQRERIGKECAAWLKKNAKKIRKDETEDNLKRHVAELLALLSWKYADLPPAIEAAVKDASAAGAWEGANQITAEKGGEFGPLWKQADEAAKAWAAHRVMELAGQTDGAKMAISDTAKAEVEKIVRQAIDEEWTPQQLQAVVEAAAIFQDTHAELIAQVETSQAQTYGWYEAWKESRKVAEVRWRVSAEHDCCDVCDLYEAQGAVKVGHEFAPGVISPPDAHPNCECWLEIVKFDPESEEDQ